MLATFKFKLFLSEVRDFRIWLLYTLLSIWEGGRSYRKDGVIIWSF